MRLTLIALLLTGCGVVEATNPPQLAARRQIIAPKLGGWRSDHCGMCCAIPARDGYRVYLTGKAYQSSLWQIGWVDVDRDFGIVAESDDAVLKANPLGHDVRGCLMPMVVDCGDHLRMHYVGVGAARYKDDLNHRPMLAISRDGGATWERNPAPLLQLDPGEDSIGTHHVWQETDGWHMIYTSVVAPPPNRRYVLRFAESNDGLTWHKPANNIALDIPDRTCGRPCVWKDGDLYRMTFCFSGGGVKYRVRCAESRDGQHFEDCGQVLDISPTGWDSEMVTYAWVLPDRKRMLYSGNEWGRTGIGIAPLHIATK